MSRTRVSFLLSTMAALGCSSTSHSGAAGAGAANGNGSPGGDISTGVAGNGSLPAGSGGDVASNVNVIITADNAYGFGYGTDASLINYFGGVENQRGVDIFDCPNGPEKYTVPAADANAGNYLYIVGYADKSYTQGVLGQFAREGGTPVFTGTGPWEVCATGLDYDLGMRGPSTDVINRELAKCKAGGGDLATTSGGFRNRDASEGGSLAVGEDNVTARGNGPVPGNEFKVACGIDSAAHWMWYEWEPNRTSGSPFIWPGGQANTTKDFLIFRLAAEYVPARVD